GKPGRKRLFSPAAAIWRASSMVCDQRVIWWLPWRWRERAMAVPHAPEPNTAIRLMRFSWLQSGILCRRAGGGRSDDEQRNGALDRNIKRRARADDHEPGKNREAGRSKEGGQ